MYIYLVRHGETDWNKRRLVQGRIDLHINENGIKQAEAMVDLFENMTFEAMIVSPLKRTLETAKIISQRANVKCICEDERIIEKDFGVSEGILIEERWQKYPNGHAPNEESFKSVRKRMKEAIMDFSKTYQNDILVVTHGVALAALVKELDQSKKDEYIIMDNVSLTVVNSESLEIEAFNLVGDNAKKWIKEKN